MPFLGPMGELPERHLYLKRQRFFSPEVFAVKVQISALCAKCLTQEVSAAFVFGFPADSPSFRSSRSEGPHNGKHKHRINAQNIWNVSAC